MDKLTLLLCGKHSSYGEISDILSQLGMRIDDFAYRCYDFISGNNESDVSVYGPYCGRTILETACTIFIGRIDPYRLLLIKRYQEHPNYDISLRHKISIQWFGDIVASEKPPSWDKLSNKNIARALLTDEYMGDIYLKKAFEDLLDDNQNEGDSEWLKELQAIQPDQVTPYIRTEADKIYSSLSKGIHQEFVIPLTAKYDKYTVKDLLQKTISLVSKLASIIHYVPTAIGNINKNELRDCLREIERNSGI